MKRTKPDPATALAQAITAARDSGDGAMLDRLLKELADLQLQAYTRSV